MNETPAAVPKKHQHRQWTKMSHLLEGAPFSHPKPQLVTTTDASVLGGGCPSPRSLPWSELGASHQERARQLIGAPGDQVCNSFVQTPYTGPPCVYPNGEHKSGVLHKSPGRQCPGRCAYLHWTFGNSAYAWGHALWPHISQEYSVTRWISSVGRGSPWEVGTQPDVPGSGFSDVGSPKERCFHDQGEPKMHLVL